MIKKGVTVLLFFLSLLVTLGLVLAAGGGGGGGSGGGSGGGGSSGGGGQHLSQLTCDDKGVLSFSQAPQTKLVNVTAPNGRLMGDVQGEWSGAQFTSDEAVFQKAGTYTVVDLVNGNKSVDCPGLKFSCKLVHIELQSCEVDQGKATAEFILENASSDDLKIQFTLPGKYVGTTRILTYTQQSHSSELDNLQVKKSGSVFVVEVPSLAEVTSLQVSLPPCVGKYYRYSTLECTDKEVERKAAVKYGDQFKCGGYLDIEDRVRCRVRLKEELRSESENFFPEECKSWKNPEQCVDLYRKVQECWEKEKPSRISCLRQKSGVLNVQQQKAECGNDKTCRDKLRTDTFTLTKLRLYNLEEEAEELQGEGEITEDQLVAFVVQMEQSKLAFNQAQSKEERRQVILRARKYWIELLRKVKA